MKQRQNFDESRKLVDFDQKRKTLGHSKFESETDTSVRFRIDQPPKDASQNDSLLKRVIMLEQRARDQDEFHYSCQNYDRKFQDLEKKYNQVCNWIQQKEDDQLNQSIALQIQERVVDLEDHVKRLFTQFKNLEHQPKNDNFEAVIQNDLNTLYDVIMIFIRYLIKIIKRHEGNFEDIFQNQKHLKQDFDGMFSQYSRFVSPKAGPRQSCEEKASEQDSPSQRETFDPKFNNYEYLKKAKSLLNIHKGEINSSIEKQQSQSRANLNFDVSKKKNTEIDQYYQMNKSIRREDAQGTSRDQVAENNYPFILTEKNNESTIKWNTQNQGKLKKQLEPNKGSFVQPNSNDWYNALSEIFCRMGRQQQTRKKDSGGITSQASKCYKL